MAPGGTLAAQPSRGPLALPVRCAWAALQFPCAGPLAWPVSCSREGLDPPFWAQTVEEMAPNGSATSFLTWQTAPTWMPLSRPHPGMDLCWADICQVRPRLNKTEASIPTLPRSLCVTAGETQIFPNLNVLICKMGNTLTNLD